MRYCTNCGCHLARDNDAACCSPCHRALMDAAIIHGRMDVAKEVAKVYCDTRTTTETFLQHLTKALDDLAEAFGMTPPNVGAA